MFLTEQSMQLIPSLNEILADFKTFRLEASLRSPMNSPKQWVREVLAAPARPLNSSYLQFYRCGKKPRHN